jgi:hypothetical protein
VTTERTTPELDACDQSFDTDDNVADDDINGVILFADVDPSDTAAVEQRAVEWRELFGGAS